MTPRTTEVVFAVLAWLAAVASVLAAIEGHFAAAGLLTVGFVLGIVGIVALERGMRP